jgi:hypothetical protein
MTSTSLFYFFTANFFIITKMPSCSTSFHEIAMALRELSQEYMDI